MPLGSCVVTTLMITGFAVNFPCGHRDSWRVRVYFLGQAGTLPQDPMTVQRFWLNGSFETLRGAAIAGAETPEEPSSSLPESEREGEIGRAHV